MLTGCAGYPLDVLKMNKGAGLPDEVDPTRRSAHIEDCDILDQISELRGESADDVRQVVKPVLHCAMACVSHVAVGSLWMFYSRITRSCLFTE